MVTGYIAKMGNSIVSVAIVIAPKHSNGNCYYVMFLLAYNTNNFIDLMMYLSIALYMKQYYNCNLNHFSHDMPWWTKFHWKCHCDIICDIAPTLRVKLGWVYWVYRGNLSFLMFLHGHSDDMSHPRIAGKCIFLTEQIAVYQWLTRHLVHRRTQQWYI